MWKYQGDRTLATYMRRRDALNALAEDLEVAEKDVPRTILKQILENLKVPKDGEICPKCSF